MKLGKIIMGLGGLIGGLGLLGEALGAGASLADSNPGKQLPGKSKKPTDMKVSRHTVRSIDDRLKYIIAKIQQGKLDPRVRQFAVQAVSKKCGDGWCTPEKNWEAEVDTMFNVVRQHVRYVRDTYGIDLYQHAKRTLQFGGGDCFVKGAQLLTRGGFISVENLEFGDEIHDGTSWVKVINTWDRGLKEVYRITLNNGCVMRLTAGHKVLDCEGVEKRVGDLKIGENLLQSRDFASGGEDLDEDEAFLIGAYLSEGCRSHTKVGGKDNRISIAGVADGKGVRERVIAILEKRGIPHRVAEREVVFAARHWPMSYKLGRVAGEKQLPHLDWSAKTVQDIVHAMEMGDGGWSTSGTNMVYSTISPTLALQYRVFQRMLGKSTSVAVLEEHGGLGKHPIYRVTVRESHHRRPWAKIKSIEVEDDQVHCFDFETESGQVYLPEADVIVRNCDDYTITLGALLQAIGYPVKCRVIQTVDSDDWNHIYLLCGLPPRGPTKWKVLDASMDKPAGWECPKKMIAKMRDFMVD